MEKHTFMGVTPVTGTLTGTSPNLPCAPPTMPPPPPVEAPQLLNKLKADRVPLREPCLIGIAAGVVSKPVTITDLLQMPASQAPQASQPPDVEATVVDAQAKE